MAVREAAGSEMARDAHKIASRQAPARVGEVVVTTAGPLPANYLLHAITLDWRSLSLSRRSVARQMMRKVVDLLPCLRCRSGFDTRQNPGSSLICPTSGYSSPAPSPSRLLARRPSRCLKARHMSKTKQSRWHWDATATFRASAGDVGRPRAALTWY